MPRRIAPRSSINGTRRATVDPPLLLAFPHPDAAALRALFDDDQLYAVAAWIHGYQHEIPIEARNRLCLSILASWPRKNRNRSELTSFAIAVLNVPADIAANAFSVTKGSARTLGSRGRKWLRESAEMGIGVYIPDVAKELARDHYGADVEVRDSPTIPGGEDPLFGWAASEAAGEQMLMAAMEAKLRTRRQARQAELQAELQATFRRSVERDDLP